MLGSQILKAHLALLLVNLLYGANHVLAKGVIPQYLDPNTFILLRVSGAALLFWILLFTKKKKTRRPLRLLALCSCRPFWSSS